MEPPGLHRVECKPICKERLPVVIFLRSDQFLGIASLFRRWPGHLDIESPGLIVAHCSQPLEPMLYLNQPFKHIATNDNLPLAAFSQRLPGARYSGQPPSPNRQRTIYAHSFIHLFRLIKSQLN